MTRLFQIFTIVFLHAWVIVLPTIGLLYICGYLK